QLFCSTVDWGWASFFYFFYFFYFFIFLFYLRMCLLRLIFPIQERLTSSSSTNPVFGICCLSGTVGLPPLAAPPIELQELFARDNAISKKFLDQIRIFNNAFAFVSLGVKMDTTRPAGRGPPTFRIHGELYHRIGSILPAY